MKKKKHFLSRTKNRISLKTRINYLITDWINEDLQDGKITDISSEMLYIRIIALAKDFSK